MKINYVRTRGFRKFEDEFETELYDVTNITGRNRSGKTNILYAIINTILGTNLTGDDRACLINNNRDSSYTEIRFTDDNGMEHTLIRGKSRFANSGTMIVLDGMPVKQEDLSRFIKDKKLLLAIINPLYFLNKKPSEQKELIDKYLSNIKPKEIFDKLNKSQQDELIEKYSQKKNVEFNRLTKEQQEDFINFEMLNICMDIAYNNLSNDEKSLLEGMPINVTEYIKELNEKIKTTKFKISNIEGKIDYAEKSISEEIPEPKKFDKDEELSIAKEELKFLNSNQKIVDTDKQLKTIQRIEQDILTKETEINDLNNKIKEGKRKLAEITNNMNCSCPTCGQKIVNDSKMTVINNMKNELWKIYDKKVGIEAKVNDLKFNRNMERCQFHAIGGDGVIDKSKRIAIVENNIKQLEQERLEIEKYNNQIAIKEKNAENTKKDIAKLKEEKRMQTGVVTSLEKAKKVAQKLYIAYIEEKLKLAKQYFKDVDIRFYSVLKETGELKEDFLITYQNRTLTELSRSETIATAVEFANMFNKISKMNFPIFIDDYESCADYDFITDYAKGTQVIVSKVEKGSNLKIADGNSDKFTIIKTESNNKVAELQAA